MNVKPPAPPPVPPQTRLWQAVNALKFVTGVRREMLLRLIDRLKKYGFAGGATDSPS